MDLTIYQIIKGPVISDKAFAMNRKYNKLVLNVHPDATKPQIKHAIESLFNVKTKKVNVLLRKGKAHLVQRRKSVKPLQKRAIVTLEAGYQFNLLDPVQVASQAPSTE